MAQAYAKQGKIALQHISLAESYVLLGGTQDGRWCVPHVARIKPDATRYFKEGDVMPPLVYEDPRLIPGLDRLLGKRQRISDV